MAISSEIAGDGNLNLNLPEKIHEDFLICKICYGKFSSQPESLPKLLVCSHTFCADCIKEYLHKRKKKSKFPCPLCRRDTPLSKDGVKGMTNNYTILGLVDLLEENSSQAGATSKQTSKTIHVSSQTQLATSNAIRQSFKQKKWPTVKTRAKPGFADLGPEYVSPKQPRRPPPHNPRYNEEAGPSSAPTGQVKPQVPVRIPGASSSLGYKRGKTATKSMALSKDMPKSMVFPSAPEDPYDDVTSVLSENMTGSLNQKTVSPPIPPPRRVSSKSIAATSIQRLKKFGSYSDARMQTNAFTQPTRVSVSTAGEIVVIDSLQMTIQIFSSNGDYISMFKVIGIQGACFIHSDHLAAATHRGVELYKTNGYKTTQFPVGNCISVIPYNFGFIALKSTSLSFFSNSFSQYKKITKLKTGKLRSASFKCIQDIAVNALKDIIVLDVGKGEIYIMDSNGNLKTSIVPSKETCGPLTLAEGLTTDKWNNILVSDTGNNRILKFSANGTYARCLLNFKLSSGNDKDLQTRGITTGKPNCDAMVIVVTGSSIAYIAIYKL